MPCASPLWAPSGAHGPSRQTCRVVQNDGPHARRAVLEAARADVRPKALEDPEPPGLGSVRRGKGWASEGEVGRKG